jgi:DNA-binding IclR family transcriptional regulator
VAAPILDVHGAVLAAVTIQAPVSRLTEEKFPAAGAQCIAAAREIEATLQACPVAVTSGQLTRS